MEGTTETQANLLKVLDGYLALFAAEAAGKTQYAQAHVVALAAEATKLHQMLLDLTTGLRTLLGKSSPLLAGFGIAPKGTPRVPSQETKALAVVKRAATRKARGKVQKLAITAIPGPKLLVLQPTVVVGTGAEVSAQAPNASNPPPAAK